MNFRGGCAPPARQSAVGTVNPAAWIELTALTAGAVLAAGAPGTDRNWDR